MELSNIPKSLQPKDGPKRAGTLVVCPVVALAQWKSELEKVRLRLRMALHIFPL